MKTIRTTFLSLGSGIVAVALGCTAEVEPTEDSVRIGAEIPKVEIGDEKPDLDISTDDDVDIDTPAPGDR